MLAYLSNDNLYIALVITVVSLYFFFMVYVVSKITEGLIPEELKAKIIFTIQSKLVFIGTIIAILIFSYYNREFLLFVLARLSLWWTRLYPSSVGFLPSISSLFLFITSISLAIYLHRKRQFSILFSSFLILIVIILAVFFVGTFGKTTLDSLALNNISKCSDFEIYINNQREIFIVRDNRLIRIGVIDEVSSSGTRVNYDSQNNSTIATTSEISRSISCLQPITNNNNNNLNIIP